MSDDLVAVMNPERIFTFQGRDYRTRKFGPREVAQLHAWMRDKSPDPRLQATRYIKELPEWSSASLQQSIWDEAVERAKQWPPTLATTEGTLLILSEEGQAEFVYIALHRTIPGFSRDDAARMVEQFDMNDFERLQQIVSPGEPGDPKSQNGAVPDQS